MPRKSIVQTKVFSKQGLGTSTVNSIAQNYGWTDLQTFAPATGTTIAPTASATASKIHCACNPAAGLAALTVTVPVLLDNQTFAFFSTQTIITLTINFPGGTTVYGNLGAISSANTGRSWTFDTATNSFYAHS